MAVPSLRGSSKQKVKMDKELEVKRWSSPLKHQEGEKINGGGAYKAGEGAEGESKGRAETYSQPKIFARKGEKTRRTRTGVARAARRYEISLSSAAISIHGGERQGKNQIGGGEEKRSLHRI